MPNNVPVEAQDGQPRQAGWDTSPQVLPPPSELQSDTLKEPAGPGPILKTHASTQLGANDTSPSDSEDGESEPPDRAPNDALSCHSPESHRMPINQKRMAERHKAKGTCIWDLNTTESSESSSDDFDTANALQWDSKKELIRVLWNNRTVDRSLETNAEGVGVMPQLFNRRQRKRKMHLMHTDVSPEGVHNRSSANHTYKKWHIEEVDDDDEDLVSTGNEDDWEKADVHMSLDSCKDQPRKSPVIIEKLIVRADFHEDNPSHSGSRNPKQLRMEQREEEPSFFPCTKCNVNFKEKRHLHRHMMYHLDGHNRQVRCYQNVPRPFICRECGRSFRDRNPLLKHMFIHQERREKLMEEIQGLHRLRDKGRNAKLQCPQCVFGTDCPKTFVQHAKTHEKDKRYFCCEECNHMASTEEELNAHLLRHTLSSEHKGAIEDERVRVSKSKTFKPGRIVYYSNSSNKSTRDTNDSIGRMSEAQAVTQKSPSKRKMFTPYRNAADKAMDCVLPKLIPKSTIPEDKEARDNDEDTYDFSAYTSEATANFLDTTENKRNPYARNYFIRRHRGSSVKEDSETAADVGHLEKNSSQTDQQSEKTDGTEGEHDSEDIQKLIIKEECVESSLWDDSPESPNDAGTPTQSFSYDVCPPFGTDRKSCPYCPAVFESGVGLSNHVRGHLHRLGLSYDARHVVSPEQVASHDRQPRIRRKHSSVARRIKKAENPECQVEHTCPLCRGWFDTKTGLSNHVRGHLKRMGKTITGTSKSPVCILNELLQDEQEHQNILQNLKGKQFNSRPVVSQNFVGSDWLFLTPAGVPVKIQHGCQPNEGVPLSPWSTSMMGQDDADRETSFSPRNSVTIPGVTEPSQSTLVDLLKQRKLYMEQLKDKSRVYKTPLSVTKEQLEENQQARDVDLHWPHERKESNKRICVHCNTTFLSAVSLSNHLRAYARKKRVAMLEGTTYSCIQKKPRLRAGTKKKLFLELPRAVEEIYSLTCRFCDLVFQGPLSVQEDWIKHLQRHLMHSSVPHIGTGMMEVLGPHREMPCSPSSLNQPMSDEHYTPHKPVTHHAHVCSEHPIPNNRLPSRQKAGNGHTLPSERPITNEHPQLHDEQRRPQPSSNKQPIAEQHTPTSPLKLLPVAS
ncbi:hypothetical protein DPEC_G00339700 [Dallia pectoralis]|uniref:Uncharacterized protein n=1 Tax=Dallia pectoralis TaxID=75939 RepID=A0ACC2F4Z9_DALPE|nr:hypothetical protein DPEC_G00339700 [Dallia pectoralis]